MDTKRINPSQLDVANARAAEQNKRVKNQEGDLDAQVNQNKNADKSFGIELSADAKELAKAHAKAFDVAKSTPEVNEERVAELKSQIASGQYQIDAGGIADGILKEAILDRLAESER